MSTIFDSTNLAKDYAEFEKAIFKTNEFKYTLSNSLTPHFKKYHRITYIIALFVSKLEGKWNKEENRFLFVGEILSDLLSNCSISLLGFHFSSQILIRRLIENFYNHVFYFEHPVEFAHLNLGRNEYTSVSELKIYLESHPLIRTDEDELIKICNDSLFNQYRELCKTVHSKGEEFMSLARNLQEIKPEIDIVKHFEDINNALLNLIYLLYKFHWDIQFTQVEKATISMSFPKNVRASLLE